MARARVELFEAIRRDHRRDGLSIRELAVRHGVHRRTVRQALDSPFPPPRKPRAFVAPKLDPAKPLIDAMLESDLDAPRKQRHTAKRVWERLVDEYGMSGLSYSTVCDYVSRRRPEIAVAAGRATEAGCVPQAHPPAAEAEVDFADLWIDLRGVRKLSGIASGATWAAVRTAGLRGEEEGVELPRASSFSPYAAPGEAPFGVAWIPRRGTAVGPSACRFSGLWMQDGRERREVRKLATNSGKGYRHGAVRRRTQSQTPNGDWTKRDSDTGQFMDGSKEPFKGVRREK